MSIIHPVPSKLLLLLILLLIAFTSCQHRYENYDALMQDYRQQGKFNGNVLVVKNGKIVYQNSWGIRTINPVDSLKLNSVFRLGSVSKQFTAMGIMMLQEKGQLQYDQDIRDFIPELPYRDITIKHLLHHTSGLPDYMGLMDKHWKPQLQDDDPKKFISGNQDILYLLAREQPFVFFEPGERWKYSNTGYVLLATIIQRASGIPFDQFLKDHIFSPAKMNQTCVYHYITEPDTRMPFRVFGFRREKYGKAFVSNDTHYLNTAQGDGGIYSSLDDLLKWDKMLRENKLVSRATLTKAFTPATLNNGDYIPYGFGWFIGKTAMGKPTVYHGGSWVGFETHIYREVDEATLIIILTNDSSKYVESIADELKNILYRKSTR